MKLVICIIIWLFNRGIWTDAKLRLLTKIDFYVMQFIAFGMSMYNNLPKIANSWLKQPPNFGQFAGPNIGSTAA